MLDLLKKIDSDLFLFFNQFHNDASDSFWDFVTTIETWIPLYAFLIFILIRVFKKDSIYLIAGVLMVVLFSDQFTSSFMKPFFERLRPCHDPFIGHLVHVATKCGGQYGFASGHSANSFGIAMFIWLTFRTYWKGTWLMFAWAFLVAFSRIMVGVHYPGDILVGGVVGLFFGWLVFNVVQEVYFRINLLPLIKN